MHMVSTEQLPAIAVFERSIKVLGWQTGAPKFRVQNFPKKKPPDFLKFIGPVTPLWVLKSCEIMHIVFTEHLLARGGFTRSIKALGWQTGAPKSREHVHPKKNVLLFEIHQTSDISMGCVAH